MPNLIQYGAFISHSGVPLSWEINCDALTEEDLKGFARLIANTFAFGDVVGVPRGGLRLAQALRKYGTAGKPTLLVADVFITGTSMEEWRAAIPGEVIGVVLFARGPTPWWIRPVFITSSWLYG